MANFELLHGEGVRMALPLILIAILSSLFAVAWRGTPSAIEPQERILAWLDVNPVRTSDGLVYLHSRDFRYIEEQQGRFVDVGFSPDGSHLWYLVETTRPNMGFLLHVPGAQAVSAAFDGPWAFWTETWWGSTQVDPYCDYYGRRISTWSPPPLQPVVVFYNNEPWHPDENMSARAQSVKDRIVALGGVVEREGIAPYIQARLPYSTLHQVARESNVTTVTHDGPAVLFDPVPILKAPAQVEYVNADTNASTAQASSVQPFLSPRRGGRWT